jgi:hypothetical protein
MKKVRWIVLALIIPAAAYAAVEAASGGDECPPTKDCPCAH